MMFARSHLTILNRIPDGRHLRTYSNLRLFCSAFDLNNFHCREKKPSQYVLYTFIGPNARSPSYTKAAQNFETGIIWTDSLYTCGPIGNTNLIGLSNREKCWNINTRCTDPIFFPNYSSEENIFKFEKLSSGSAPPQHRSHGRVEHVGTVAGAVQRVGVCGVLLSGHEPLTRGVPVNPQRVVPAEDGSVYPVVCDVGYITSVWDLWTGFQISQQVRCVDCNVVVYFDSERRFDAVLVYPVQPCEDLVGAVVVVVNVVAYYEIFVFSVFFRNPPVKFSAIWLSNREGNLGGGTNILALIIY